MFALRAKIKKVARPGRYRSTMVLDKPAGHVVEEDTKAWCDNTPVHDVIVLDGGTAGQALRGRMPARMGGNQDPFARDPPPAHLLQGVGDGTAHRQGFFCCHASTTLRIRPCPFHIPDQAATYGALILCLRFR